MDHKPDCSYRRKEGQRGTLTRSERTRISLLGIIHGVIERGNGFGKHDNKKLFGRGKEHESLKRKTRRPKTKKGGGRDSVGGRHGLARRRKNKTVKDKCV